MPTRHSALRVAAASLATGVLTVGSALPVYAAGKDTAHRAEHSSARSENRSENQSRNRAENKARSNRVDSEGAGMSDRRRTRHDASHGNSVSAKSARRPRADTSEPPRRSNPQERAAAKRSGKTRPGEKRTAAKHTPPKHTPVTVCHLLGNGGYHLLTFDDSALKAHVGHHDLYPVPASGCPRPEAHAPSSQEDSEQEYTEQEETETGVVTDDGTQTDLVPGLPEVDFGTVAEVLGVEQEVTASSPSAAVLGAQRSSAGPSSAAVAPAAGVLPQTGAGEVALTLAAGIGLLAAGMGLLRRRRTLGSR